MKFKVGDRVEHKEFGKGNIVYYCRSKSQPYLIEFDKQNSVLHDGSLSGKKHREEHCWWCYEREIQLIEPKPFTKSDLKDGDIVTYQDKTKAINTKNRLINECGSVCFLSDYNEDLTRKEENCKHLNIIKVERPTGYETVFKRKEDILNEAEKKYLSGVIRPFRNEVRGIIKEKLNDKNWISIDFKNDACMDFPNLKKKDDYKGMEVGKLYSLEELGL